MKNEILFIEKQRFNQWWLWLLLLSIHFFFLYKICNYFFFQKSENDNIVLSIGFIIPFCILLLTTGLLVFIQLQILVKKDGIYFRFYPFQLQFKYYNWDMIAKSYIRQYKPISEYGGWGLRLGLLGSGAAYNVSGNFGLQLVLKNNKKILIGTNKANQLEAVLQTEGQIKE